MLVGEMGDRPANLKPFPGVTMVLPRSVMDINSIGKIKDKLWSKYPLSLLDLSDEWAVLTHKGDMTDLRCVLGQKWFNFMFDSAIYYSCFE